jgi:hypothetical protein
VSNEKRLRPGRGEISGCLFEVILTWIGWTKSVLNLIPEQDTSKIQIGTIFVVVSYSTATLIRGQPLLKIGH